MKFIDEDVIVAHNDSFDMKFLLTNMFYLKMEYNHYKVLDTLALSRKYIKETENHKLPILKKFLKLNQYKSHEALHDCYVAGELYKYCYEQSLIKN